MTRFEHRWEIQAADGWQEFAQVTDELTRWVDRRAWATGEGRKAVFDRAAPWLRQRRVLLPALESLTRLVGHVVGQAHLRLWETLLELVTADQAMLLLGLVEVPDGLRISALERLRREPTGDTASALVKALGRVAEVAGIGLGGLDLSVVPQRRVVDLARAGMTANATSSLPRRRGEPTREPNFWPGMSGWPNGTSCWRPSICPRTRTNCCRSARPNWTGRGGTWPSAPRPGRSPSARTAGCTPPR